MTFVIFAHVHEHSLQVILNINNFARLILSLLIERSTFFFLINRTRGSSQNCQAPMNPSNAQSIATVTVKEISAHMRDSMLK